MFIIIDGATCAGKTTLTAQLYDYLADFGDIRLLHKSSPEVPTRRWVLNDYVMSLEDYVPGVGPNVLADRWHWGEITYSPIYRPDTNKDGFGLLGRSGWRWVELFLLSRGAYVIQVDATDEVLVERLNTRGDDHVQNPQQLRQLALNYRLAADESPSLAQILDTSDNGQANLDEIYFTALQSEVLAKDILDITPEYIGNPRPDVLLVGDKRNVTEKYGDETHLPFMPVDASSGVYLLEALPDDFWHRVGIVNGNDMSGDLHELWEVLGRPRPIALGNEAEKALKRAGFESEEFTLSQHPAYVRRFLHDTQDTYGQLIAAAAEMKGIHA